MRLLITLQKCPLSRSLRQMPRGGVINYREEEKKILDSILGREVYDNRIRPSGMNGTATSSGKNTCVIIAIRASIQGFLFEHVGSTDRSQSISIPSAYLTLRNFLGPRNRFSSISSLRPTASFILLLLFSDAATLIVVNLYIRSFAKIDDVKMVPLN